ncbi:MAG TPA: diguanylate cyclase [Alphaproteobacteria bacterium]|nr:diguanylate cyclase [Alphaproteobacteria bacterium]
MKKISDLIKLFQSFFTIKGSASKKLFKKNEIHVSKATVATANERFVLIRAASLSVDFYECILDLYHDKEKNEAIHTTQQLLFDVSHAIGLKDGEYFQKKLPFINPATVLKVGRVLFANTGWMPITVFPGSKPSKDDNFILFFEHPSTFESHSWLKAGKKTDRPVCIMTSGYSSGLCEKLFGIPLVTTEITCRAKEDKSCIFVMAHPARITCYIKDYLKKNPEIAKEATHYEIQDFFKIKMAEVSLKKVNAALRATNRKLKSKSKALKEKNHVIELLSEFRELLPACATNEEVYTIFNQYVAKLFPNYRWGLWIYTEEKKKFQNVKTWGSMTDLEKRNFSFGDCFALRHDQIYKVNFSSSKPHCHHMPKKAEGYTCFPMALGDEIFGVVSVIFGRSKFSQESQAIFARFTDNMTLALSNIRLRESLLELSMHDYLTGLFNRRYMEETLKKEIAKATRGKSNIGLIMFDIDHFKNFNDTYGHEAGDTILINVGKFLKEHFREGDIICRFGGEEFVIILVGANKSFTLDRAENLREKFKNLPTQFGNKFLGHIEISIGVAVFPENGQTSRELLDAVDEALYRAKNDGRNRVRVATT